MTILIVGGVCILAVIVLAVTWALLPHGDHHASRPARRGPASWAREQRARAGRAPRAVRRSLVALRRLPGTTRHTRDLAAEDLTTIAVIAAMRAEDTGGLRELHHDMGPGAGLRLSPVTTATCAGPTVPKVDSPAPADTPGPAVRTCSVEQVTWRDSDPLGPSDCGEETRTASRQFLATLAPAVPTNGPAATTPPVAAGHQDPPAGTANAQDITPPSQAAASTTRLHTQDAGESLGTRPGAPQDGPAATTPPVAAGHPSPADEPGLPASVTAQLAPLAALVDQLREADDTASFEAIAAAWGA